VTENLNLKEQSIVINRLARTLDGLQSDRSSRVFDAALWFYTVTSSFNNTCEAALLIDRSIDKHWLRFKCTQRRISMYLVI